MLDMNASKQTKGAVKSLAGLALLILVIAAAMTYFSDSLTVARFEVLALAVSVVALAAAFFGWLAMRVAGVLVALAVLLLGGIIFLKHPSVKSGYQAVFLSNGQVYFGHLKNIETKSPVLTDIYYIQSNQQNPQSGNQAQQPQPQLSLVKLGNELHGPEDSMAIRADQVLFWENLKDDGKVVQAIHDAQKKK